MTDHLSNPAGRLMQLLDHCWNTQAHVGITQAWAQYLGWQDLTYSPEQLRAFADIVRLPEQVREAIEAAQPTDEPIEELLEELPKARDAIAFNAAVGQQIQVMKQRYDRGTIKSLQTCSYVIDRDTGRPQPAPAVERIKAAAQALVDEIENADDLDPEARIALLRHAEAVLSAVRLVKVGGAEALQKEGDVLLGHLIRDDGLRSKGQRSPKVWKQVAALLTGFVLLGDATHTAVEMPKNVVTLLQIEVPQHPIVLAPGPGNLRQLE
jgi:hypothetical protein